MYILHCAFIFAITFIVVLFWKSLTCCLYSKTQSLYTVSLCWHLFIHMEARKGLFCAFEASRVIRSHCYGSNLQNEHNSLHFAFYTSNSLLIRSYHYFSTNLALFQSQETQISLSFPINLTIWIIIQISWKFCIKRNEVLYESIPLHLRNEKRLNLHRFLPLSPPLLPLLPSLSPPSSSASPPPPHLHPPLYNKRKQTMRPNSVSFVFSNIFTKTLLYPSSTRLFVFKKDSDTTNEIEI